MAFWPGLGQHLFLYCYGTRDGQGEVGGTCRKKKFNSICSGLMSAQLNIINIHHRVHYILFRYRPYSRTSTNINAWWNCRRNNRGKTHGTLRSIVLYRLGLS